MKKQGMLTHIQSNAVQLPLRRLGYKCAVSLRIGITKYLLVRARCRNESSGCNLCSGNE